MHGNFILKYTLSPVNLYGNTTELLENIASSVKLYIKFEVYSRRCKVIFSKYKF